MDYFLLGFILVFILYLCFLLPKNQYKSQRYTLLLKDGTSTVGVYRYNDSPSREQIEDGIVSQVKSTGVQESEISQILLE